MHLSVIMPLVVVCPWWAKAMIDAATALERYREARSLRRRRRRNRNGTQQADR
jgi:hypothetical protein